MAPRLKRSLTGFFKPRFLKNGALVRLGTRPKKTQPNTPAFCSVPAKLVLNTLLTNLNPLDILAVDCRNVVWSNGPFHCLVRWSIRSATFMFVLASGLNRGGLTTYDP